MIQPQPRSPAETYEQYFVPAMFLPWSTVLLRHAAPQSGERVLDVACGTGIVAHQAAPLVGAASQIVALDMNPAMLEVARAIQVPLGATIDWREGDAMALPFRDGAFDVVLCQHGLQFVPDRARAVREMHRVLAPGGRAVVIVLQALERHPVFEALMESVARHLSLSISSVMIPFALSDADELRNLFTAAGFKKVEILPEPNRFVPLAVTSSAAAVPAFAQLEQPERAALIETVREETASIIQRYRDAEVISFPMYAYVAVATR